MGVDMATGTGWPFGGPEVSVAAGLEHRALLENGRFRQAHGHESEARGARGAKAWCSIPIRRDRARSLPATRFTRATRARCRAGWCAASSTIPSSTTRRAGRRSCAAEFQQGCTAMTCRHTRPSSRAQGRLDADTAGRIEGDYRRTLAKLHLDYVNRWVTWSHAQGFSARNQAHGAPGNLLDLYAAADIPETESFGLTELPIAGLRGEADTRVTDPDPPLGLVGRFASSAAHVTGKPLVSSETLTWLRENFRESPAAAKPQLDRLFVAGINHIFYHGVSLFAGRSAVAWLVLLRATQLRSGQSAVGRLRAR